ncbi:hypothetical protein N2152v2_005489 [Parachlorella kessleri]
MVCTRSRAASVALDASPERRQSQAEARKHGASKRKLFDCCTDCPASVSGTPEVAKLGTERCASLDSAPPTPKTVDRERPQSESPAVPAPALHPALEPVMQLAMKGWCSNLVALQPKVQVSDATLLGAVALMREFAVQRPDVVGLLHTSGPHLFTYTCAAMWMASKTGDIRTAIPNRTLMSQACQIHPQALSDFELDLCVSLNWEVTKVLRAADLLQ